jgi:hypothetical protein
MKFFNWLKDQFSLEHIYQCTHCGKKNVKVTEISWYYEIYAPPINYPLKRRSIHQNWLCEECQYIIFENSLSPDLRKFYRENKKQF